MQNTEAPAQAGDTARRPALFMRWLHLAFIHWPVEADAVRGLLPPGIELDTFGGHAWVGLVPFTMRDVRHVTPLGRVGIPTATHFHECNVRTYVRAGRDAKAGVWFFSLDAASRLAVLGARALWNLPYFYAAMSLQRDGDRVRYRTVRGGGARPSLTAEWQAGTPLLPSAPGSLSHFLTERYALYSVSRSGAIWRGDISHPRWSLRDARLLSFSDGLVRAAGVNVAGEPIVWHADELAVDAFALKQV
ncbi:MAG: DUF2071 domain-containing protein [Phycisphaerales bacterium]|nr:DUF2071 domain-containing protein [Phycisphaerales bacterium]